MAENEKKIVKETEEIEYEDVKRMPVAAFIGAGLAFGVAAGFSVGDLLFKSFELGMIIFSGLGLLGGLALGLINHYKKKPE